MLIRWATKEEIKKLGYLEQENNDYSVLVAIERMTDKVLGSVGFSRENEFIDEVQIFVTTRESKVKENLLLCADRQINPKGRSFHYNYPNFIRDSQKEFCPVCNNEPAPDEQTDLQINDKVWIVAEYPGQGQLFGKMYVMPRPHVFHFEDMPFSEMEGFMSEVQRVGRALRKVTGATKINYEMHSNTGAHLHMHICPRYLDDDFAGKAIDLSCPSNPAPYESYEEFLWFMEQMKKELYI